MKRLNVLILLTLVAFTSACTSIKSINKLGEDAYIVNENEWEGTWIAGDGSLQLKVIDRESSEIEIMFIEEGKIQKYKVFIKQNGEDSYMNLLDKDNYYLFAKFKVRKNLVIIWLPSTDILKTAISSKEIEGIITKGKDLLIQSDKNTLNKYFIDNKDKMLFEYEEPVIFRRLVE